MLSDQQSPDSSGLTLDFVPSFKSLQQKTHVVTLQFKDIRFSIAKKAWCGLGKEKSSKKILQGLSGRAAPKEVVAIMGPSGAGKTTLLNVLAGRVVGGSRGRELTGDLLVNGEKMRPKAFRRVVAYVQQFDSLYATATARESLEFSARLRLPAHVLKKDRELLVNDMLDSMGLTKVQDTMVGSEQLRGLSGGERKRVSIGVELVFVCCISFSLSPPSGNIYIYLHVTAS